ncbi:MAG: 2Fe-2S iron-sulfur cluster-binding protein [Zestosphaera sp.]
MVKIYVNNYEVDVPPGTLVIDAIEKAGYEVPTLCYLKGLFNEATCRICVVKVNGRVVPACKFPVSENAKIIVDDSDLRKLRKINLELLLATHEIKCWSCVRKGACELLDLSKKLGVEGIPVCSECSLREHSCLVLKGIPCLGPLTVAGCEAECPRRGSPCIGCRGYIVSEDVWAWALKNLYNGNIDLSELKSLVSFFWTYLPQNLRRLIEEVSSNNY